MELTEGQKKELDAILAKPNFRAELIQWIEEVATEHGNEKYDEGCNDTLADQE